MNLFSPTSGAQKAAELIPDGTLSRAVISVSDKGFGNSKQTGGEYINILLTLEGEPFHGRKVFGMIGSPLDERNSEAWRSMAVSDLTRIYEACGVFDPSKPETYNQFNVEGVEFYDFIKAFDGQTVAVEIGIEKGKDGNADKNRVKTWLTPSTDHGSKRGKELWDMLLAGATTSRKGPAAASATGAAPSGNQSFSSSKALAAAGSSSAAPGWLKDRK